MRRGGKRTPVPPQSHPRLWELTDILTGPCWPCSQTGLVFALDCTIHPFTFPSPTFGSSAFKAGSEAETGNRSWGPCLLGGTLREGTAWVQKVAGCIFPPARRDAPQMPAPSPRVSPHTEPTSIWRTISPIPAPVTSTVVAQPDPKEKDLG